VSLNEPSRTIVNSLLGLLLLTVFFAPAVLGIIALKLAWHAVGPAATHYFSKLGLPEDFEYFAGIIWHYIDIDLCFSRPSPKTLLAECIFVFGNDPADGIGLVCQFAGVR
jgi:hypothetical protein